jgi:hypothetical protein
MLREKDARINELNHQIELCQERELEWNKRELEWNNEKRELMKQNTMLLKQLGKM